MRFRKLFVTVDDACGCTPHKFNKLFYKSSNELNLIIDYSDATRHNLGAFVGHRSNRIIYSTYVWVYLALCRRPKN